MCIRFDLLFAGCRMNLYKKPLLYVATEEGVYVIVKGWYVTAVSKKCKLQQ